MFAILVEGQEHFGDIEADIVDGNQSLSCNLNKKSAEQLGIDTNAMPTPEQKEFTEKYQFVQKITVTENGKTFYRYRLTPKKKD